MRIRSIKPDYFKDEELAELPPLARILFAGLWCMADCEGRIKASPKRIKVEVLPYDDVEIDPLLIQLHEKGFILRYGSADGSNQDHFIQVIQFHRHQRITGKEAESESLIQKYNPAIHGETSGKHRGNNHEATGITGREGKGREGKDTVLVVSPVELRKAFDTFWSEYPRKVAKEKAWQAFRKPECLPNMESILSAIRAQRNSPEWLKEDGRFIPHAATWLNGKRWQDEGVARRARVATPLEATPEDRITLPEQFRQKLAREAAEA